jgi:hypothetical protein
MLVYTSSPVTSCSDFTAFWYWLSIGFFQFLFVSRLVTKLSALAIVALGFILGGLLWTPMVITHFLFLTSLVLWIWDLSKWGVRMFKDSVVFCPCFYPARKATFSLSLSASLRKPLLFTSVFVCSLDSMVYGSECLEAAIAPKLSLCGSVNFLGRSLISSLRTVFCLVVFPGGFSGFFGLVASPCNQGDYSLPLASSKRFTAGEYATRFYGGVRLMFLHPAERNHSLVFVLLAYSLSVLTSLFSETSVIVLYFHCVHAVFQRTIDLVARSHKLSQFWCASI